MSRSYQEEKVKEVLIYKISMLNMLASKKLEVIFWSNLKGNKNWPQMIQGRKCINKYDLRRKWRVI